MSAQPSEKQRWALGVDTNSLINALELMEDLHLEAMKDSTFGSLERAEHRLLAKSYQRTVWALKYEQNIGRIQ